jgi:hypothetical protein
MQELPDVNQMLQRMIIEFEPGEQQMPTTRTLAICLRAGPKDRTVPCEAEDLRASQLNHSPARIRKSPIAEKNSWLSKRQRLQNPYRLHKNYGKYRIRAKSLKVCPQLPAANLWGRRRTILPEYRL